MSSKELFNCLDNLFEAVVIIDAKGNIEYFNNNFVTLLKEPPRVVRKAKLISDLIPKNVLDVMDYVSRAEESKSTVLSEEARVVLAETDYTLVLKAQPIECEGKSCFLISLNDLSVEKKLYEKYKDQMEELKNTHSQIVQADKLRTIGELTAGVSHEINNPLTVASGNAEIIEFCLENENLEEERDGLVDAVANIKDSHVRIQKIIHSMKDFLHKSEDAKEYCNLQDLIEKSVSLVKRGFDDAKAEIKVDIQRADLVGLVNRLKIEQVMVNLFKNALDAMLEAKIDKPSLSVTLSHKDEDSYMILDIIDNGPGIPDEIRDEVFNTFFTTKDAGKGTGLGLSIASRIIQSHTGKLEIVATDSGCHFRISLPIIEVSSFADNDSLLDNSASVKGKKILVVDNEVAILNLCKKFFENTDYLFIGSTSGPDALRVLKKFDVDLVITDYKMPEMDGSEFAKLAREMGKTMPFLYMTTKEKVARFQEDKEKLGITGLILKPFSRDEFFNTIEQTLEVK